jgi:hypothetical protein
MAGVDQQPSAGAYVPSAVLGNEAGIEGDKQASGSVSQIDFAPVVGMDESPIPLVWVETMTADDLVYARRVGEEASGSTVAVDIGDRVEDEGRRNVDERPGIKDRGVPREVSDGREELQSITGVAVLIIPKTSGQILHHSQDGTAPVHESGLAFAASP